MKKAKEQGDVALAPLEEKDLLLMTTAKVKLSQGEILKLYVKNANELDVRQKRKVMGFIQAQRSKHAKEVFLKELSAVGRKFKAQEEARVEGSRIRYQKDPLKLKLESITL